VNNRIEELEHDLRHGALSKVEQWMVGDWPAMRLTVTDLFTGELLGDLTFTGYRFLDHRRSGRSVVALGARLLRLSVNPEGTVVAEWSDGSIVESEGAADRDAWALFLADGRGAINEQGVVSYWDRG
jgi:hypothetical protein